MAPLQFHEDQNRTECENISDPDHKSVKDTEGTIVFSQASVPKKFVPFVAT
jgi:hypothetical protein